LRLRKIKALVILFIAVPLVPFTLLPPASGLVSGPLKYTLGYKGYPSPGATILLVHNFTADWSTTDIMINSFTVTTRWGFLNATGSYGFPLIVSWPGSRLVNTSLQIPASTLPGKYPVNVWVNWDYYQIVGGYWVGGQDVIVNATLQVSPTPPFSFPITIPSLPSWILSGFLFYLAAVSFLTVVVARREEMRKRKVPVSR
jgi:hypothetical protein